MNYFEVKLALSILSGRTTVVNVEAETKDFNSMFYRVWYKEIPNWKLDWNLALIWAENIVCNLLVAMTDHMDRDNNDD